MCKEHKHFVKLNLHSLPTLLDTPVQSDAIQYSSFAMNSTFTKLFLSFMIQDDSTVFIIDIMVDIFTVLKNYISQE